MKNVWIVDDDRSIRWVLEKALQKADILCKTFSEAESVLQAIKKEQPALILSDIHMPGKSGLEMLAEIKKSYPKLPIIIMTAYDWISIEHEAKLAGLFGLGQCRSQFSRRSV